MTVKIRTVREIIVPNYRLFELPGGIYSIIPFKGKSNLFELTELELSVVDCMSIDNNNDLSYSDESDDSQPRYNRPTIVCTSSNRACSLTARA